MDDGACEFGVSALNELATISTLLGSILQSKPGVKCVSVPFFNSIVTVSLAHFIKNLEAPSQSTSSCLIEELSTGGVHFTGGLLTERASYWRPSVG